jgi:hypothetical protein
LGKKGKVIFQIPVKLDVTSAIHDTDIHASRVQVDTAAIITADLSVFHEALRGEGLERVNAISSITGFELGGPL